MNINGGRTETRHREYGDDSRDPWFLSQLVDTPREEELDWHRDENLRATHEIFRARAEVGDVGRTTQSGSGRRRTGN